LLRAFRVLDAVADALLLQLLWLVCSLPVVTAVPAAVALQRRWAASRAGEPVRAGDFLREMALAWRQAWVPGVLGPLLVVAWVGSVLFWRAVPGYPAVLALGLVLGLALPALTFHLALLAASEREVGDAWRTWFRSAAHDALTRMPRYLLALAGLLTWFALVRLAPPLLFVGAGILPALLAAAAGGSYPREPAQASRS